MQHDPRTTRSPCGVTGHCWTDVSAALGRSEVLARLLDIDVGQGPRRG